MSPEAVGEPEFAGAHTRPGPAVAQGLRREDPLPHRKRSRTPCRNPPASPDRVERPGSGSGGASRTRGPAPIRDLEPVDLELLGDREQQPAGGRPSRRAARPAAGDAPRPDHRLADRAPSADAAAGSQNSSPLRPSSVPQTFCSRGAAELPRAAELLGHWARETLAEQRADQRHDERLGQRALIARAQIDGHHETVAVREHGPAETAEPVGVRLAFSALSRMMVCAPSACPVASVVATASSSLNGISGPPVRAPAGSERAGRRRTPRRARRQDRRRPPGRPGSPPPIARGNAPEARRARRPRRRRGSGRRRRRHPDDEVHRPMRSSAAWASRSTGRAP